MNSRVIVLAATSLACAPALAAQEADSILARLERAERLIEVLQAQVAEQAENKVEPGAGGRLELFGLVLLNGFSNSAAVNNADVPYYVRRPDPASTLPASFLGGTLRQTRVGIRGVHPQVLRGEFSGELELSLFGGQLAEGRLASLVRIRRARAVLRWPNAWILFGQEAPPIAEVNPSSFAAVDRPGFTAAGNLWFWLPQVRVGVEAGRAVKVGLEVAAVAPMGPPDQPQQIDTEPNLAELSRRPFVQGRVLVRWGDPEIAGGEVGIGGHYGWIATPDDDLRVTKAAALTARFFATRYVEVRGEAFTGQALATLGSGGVAQDFGFGGVPLRTRGGWVQLNVLPTFEWEVGGGFGIDDPNDDDLDLNTQRRRNVHFEGHAHWRPHPLVFGVEVRRIETRYGVAATTDWGNTHVNVAMGFAF